MEQERRKKIEDKRHEIGMHAMCDEILTSIKQDYEETPMESWESYERRTRSALLDNMGIYQERFASGYKALLMEVADMYRDGELM